MSLKKSFHLMLFMSWCMYGIINVCAGLDFLDVLNGGVSRS